MSHERSNEGFHWKNKLDEFDGTGTQPVLDKAASWEKLQGRLLQKANKKKFVWYWIAAASIILIAGMQFIDFNDNPVNTVSRETPGSQDTSVDSLVSIPPDQIPMFRETIVKKEKSMIKTQKKQLPVIDPQLKNRVHFPVQLDTFEIESPNTAVTIFNAVDTSMIVSTLPAKKKLRVVHINELGKSVQEEIQFTRNTPSPATQLTPFNQGALPGFSLSRNASDNIVKIKISPSN
ncbi:MAG: hypothetical protein ACXWCG_00720 [Flavitalea sp.]